MSDPRAIAPSPACDVFKNCRRVCARANCNFQGSIRIHGNQPLVKTESRFKSTFATAVQAARSAGFHAGRKRPDRARWPGPGGGFRYLLYRSYSLV